MKGKRPFMLKFARCARTSLRLNILIGRSVIKENASESEIEENMKE